jgi:hypothetical protein
MARMNGLEIKSRVTWLCVLFENDGKRNFSNQTYMYKRLAIPVPSLWYVFLLITPPPWHIPTLSIYPTPFRRSRDESYPREFPVERSKEVGCVWENIKVELLLGGAGWVVYYIGKQGGLPCAACVCIREYSSMYMYNYNIIRSLCILYIKITRATAQFLSILYCICGQMAARRSVNQMTQQGGRRSRNISCPSL